MAFFTVAVTYFCTSFGDSAIHAVNSLELTLEIDYFVPDYNIS